jgi:hypothetical protein
MKAALTLAVLCSVLLIPVTVTAAPEDPGGTFFDDDGSTHEPSIEAVAAEGITLGCDQVGTVYCPTAPLSRAQMATFLARALNLGATTTDYFTDDTGNTHESNINKIADAGISLGCNPEGTNYCPDDPLNREQMATFLARGLDLEPLDPAPRPETTTGFQLSLFTLIEDCDDPLACTGSIAIPVGLGFFALEGWDLANWSISSDLDREVFEDPTTRTEFIFNGGSQLRTAESFEIDVEDKARKRYSFQFPDTLTGTHELEGLWYQSDILSYRVTLEITIQG